MRSHRCSQSSFRNLSAIQADIALAKNSVDVAFNSSALQRVVHVISRWFVNGSRDCIQINISPFRSI
jgi:hypothetical protein